MLMGFNMDFFGDLLSCNKATSNHRIIFTSIDEFEKISGSVSSKKLDEVVIQPFLQVWAKLSDGRNKVSGFVVLKGIPEYTFIIVGYEAESLGFINLALEREKYLEILQESIITHIVERNISNKVITLDVIIQTST